MSADNIFISNKLKKNGETSKYFIGYSNDIYSVVPLCIILPKMSGYIKYFNNGEENMSFKIEGDEVYIKYNSIWNKIKELLDVKFYSEPIYDDKYIKTKVKMLSDVMNALFNGDIPKERIEYACILCISIDSVLKIDGKYYPQIYLEQCKYRMKRKELKNFIDYEVDSDSDYESD